VYAKTAFLPAWIKLKDRYDTQHPGHHYYRSRAGCDYLIDGPLGASRSEETMNAKFQAAHRYAKLIPKMKTQNRRTAVKMLFGKIKAAIHG